MKNLEVTNKRRIFADRKDVKRRCMETKAFTFDHPVGTFRKSVRAYREYKKQWQARMEEKLAKMEEEIQRAKESHYFEFTV